MKKYTCIVADDETLARELLASHIAKIPELELVASCQNALEAKAALQALCPDILFLDIQMPDLTGLELLKLLPRKPATVLTTAYAEYALQGYELDVLDYLLKPIEFGRFFKAVSKCIEWLDRAAPPLRTMDKIASPETPGHVFVKADSQMVKIVFSELLFVEAMQKYVRFHTSTGARIVSLMSIGQLERLFPEERFFRAHRSFLVNLDRIDRVDGLVLHIGKHQLPLSKERREALLGRLK